MNNEKPKGFLMGMRRFLLREEGLVTVEWVALAAAVVVGGITIVWLVMTNLKTPAGSIGTTINGAATTSLPAAP